MVFFLLWGLPALIAGGMGVFLWLSTSTYIRHCKRIAGWIKSNGVVERAEAIRYSSRRYNRALSLNDEQGVSAAEWIRASLRQVSDSSASSTTTQDGVSLTRDNLGQISVSIGGKYSRQPISGRFEPRCK